MIASYNVCYRTLRSQWGAVLFVPTQLVKYQFIPYANCEHQPNFFSCQQCLKQLLNFAQLNPFGIQICHGGESWAG